MKDELKEIIDFYEFKKERHSTAALEDCLLICQNKDVKLFLGIFAQLLSEYKNKGELINDICRLADMEEKSYATERRN